LRASGVAGFDLQEGADAGAAVVQCDEVHTFQFLVSSVRGTVTDVKLNRRRLLVLLTVWLVVGLAALVWHGPSEPRYQGTSLSQWLRLYRPFDRGASAHSQEADAVRHIGTNALPFLVSWMEDVGSLPPWKERLLRYAWNRHLPGNEILLETLAKHELLAERAASGFEILGEAAAPAIPELVRVANHGNSASSRAATIALAHLGKDALVPLLTLIVNSASPVRDEAMWSVARMHYLGTNAHPAVVLLIQYLNDPQLAPSAANVLGSLRLESDVTVPALAESTHSSEPRLRMAAATSLGMFGASARPAVPELLKMLDDPSLDIRQRATNALQLIAPEALRKTEP
jgi:hypothetical protein